jgi:hypothetical protein
LNALFQIRLVGSLVLLDVSQAAFLVPASVGRHAIEVQSAQELREFLLEDFLADIGLAALPFAVRAVVVDILLLLHLPDDRATAVAARDHPTEGEVALPTPVFLDPTAIHHALDALP